MHGRPDITLVESAAHYMPRSVLSFPMKKRLWNSYLCNNSIGFDNSRCMRKYVVYRGLTLYPHIHFTTELTLIMYPIPDGVSVTTGSIHMTNPNPLKLFFPVEV